MIRMYVVPLTLSFFYSVTYLGESIINPLDPGSDFKQGHSGRDVVTEGPTNRERKDCDAT